MARNGTDGRGKAGDAVKWTYVRDIAVFGSDATMFGWVSHKEDLSDLQEPYLSAVKQALEARG